MRFLRYFCCMSIVWVVAFTGCGLKYNENMTHDAIHIQAKADAESDVKRDFNALTYFGVGVSVPFATGVCCLTGFCLNGWSIEGGDPYLGATVVGAAVFGVLIGYQIRSLNPPPERLIGKSPKYIMLYADAYRAEIGWYRMRSIAAGSILGSTAAIIMFAIVRRYQEH